MVIPQDCHGKENPKSKKDGDKGVDETDRWKEDQ